MNPFILILLSLGHLATDLSAGAIPALLPFFQRSFGLSYGSLGFLNGVFQFTASVLQPLFGLLTDRIPARLLLPLGCIAAGLMVGLTGFATGYSGLLLLIALAGVGVAVFHPLGYRLASQHSGTRRGTATSVFSVGGLLGGAIGPLLATALVLRFDAPGTLGIALPGILVAALIWWRAPRQQPTSLPRLGGGLAAPLRTRFAPMSLLTLVVILRSAATVSLNTFIPLYYIDVVGASETTASRMLSLLLVSGAIGTLLGGPLSDRIGRLRVLAATLALMTPALLIFLNSQGIVAATALSFAGFFLVSSFAVTVVMAQDLWPENVSLASGMRVGFAFGVGGLVVPLIGLIAEHWGLLAALQVIVVFPVSAVVLTILLAAAMRRLDRVGASAASGHGRRIGAGT